MDKEVQANIGWFDVTGYIYLFETEVSGRVGPVKIGFTTVHPRYRLKALSTSCPYPIRILTFFRAYRWMESIIHERLDDYNTGKDIPPPAPAEWFWQRGKVKTFVNRVLRGAVNNNRTPEDWQQYLRIHRGNDHEKME